MRACMKNSSPCHTAALSFRTPRHATKMLKWFSRSSAARSANSCPTAVPQAATQAVQSAAEAQVLPATADPMSLAVSVKEDGKGNVLLSVIPPESGPRPKLDVAIVIDKSGSMGCTANENGGEDVKLFSKMDLVKRAAEVIARSLTPDDSLTLIAFASTVMRLTRRERMDAVGLSRALTHIAALQPGGGTALWDGLHAGLHEIEIAYRDDDSDASRHGDGAASGRDGSSASDAEGERLPVVIMLTDGQPSPSPPAGELEELRKYLAARDAAIAAASDNNDANGRPKGFTAPPRAAKLITMGFGYDVNSKLLVDLANAHDGCAGGNEFAFIPDGTMLLTTFVNLMANLQSVCARHAVLRISAPPTTAAAAAGNNPGYNANSADIASLVEVTGEACWKQVGAEVVGSRTSRTGAETETTGPGIAINLGCVAYGQPRQVVLSAKRDTTSDSGTAATSAAAPVPLLPDWRAWDLDLSYEPLADSFTSVDVTGAAEVEGSGGGGEASMEAAAEGGVVVVPGGGLLVERDELAVTQQLHRSLAVSAIAAAARWASLDLSEAQEAVKKVAAATMKLPIFNAGSAALGSGAVGPHPIVEDLTGQVSEAVSTREVWNRWGQHYVKSLLCAHKTQTCNNFKDPGVQVYGGAYTKALRDALNAMCDSLPVPRPSIPARDGTAWGTPAQPISADTFRGAFNNRYGGCFGPGSHVLMADGSLKAVEDLRKGDMVRTRHAPAAANTTTAAGAFGSKSGVDGVDGASVSEEARVECVVTYRGVATVRLPGSGLSITPWHPVRMADGTWRFPADLVLEAAATAATATARRLTTGHDAGSSSGADACGADEGKGIAAVMEGLMERPAAVYNLVLDRGHVVVVEGVEAVTLGHGFTEDVVRHPYYGTQAVLRDLQQQPGWSSGWVDLGLVTAKVDPHTGLVCGYEPSGTSTATCASATKSAAADGPSYIMNSSMPVAAVAICG